MTQKYRPDPHSCFNPREPRVAYISLVAEVDFVNNRLHCTVVLTLTKQTELPTSCLTLDTSGLDIQEITVLEKPAIWKLDEGKTGLDSGLRITLPRGTRRITITYTTHSDASALQWVTPEQTFGKKRAAVYSQCQSTHARSIVPCQDTPMARIRWDASFTFPTDMRSITAGELISREDHDGWATERWMQGRPLPSYLLGFYIGRLESKYIGPRSQVWAEPEIVDHATDEFSELERIISTTESVFGTPLPCGRIHVLIMPPNFPYGGMENWGVPFVTATILTKRRDKSLIGTLVHEIVHMWTGNMVTYASLEHFWLNEGWTRFIEILVLEMLYGHEVAELNATIGWRVLETELKRLPSKLTNLRTNLAGVDPESTLTQIAYEKGSCLLRLLMNTVGRERFFEFIRRYVLKFQYQSITTEQFLDFFEAQFPGILASVNAAQWVYEPGLPSNAPKPTSTKLAAIESLSISVPDEATFSSWSAVEKKLYLEQVFDHATLEMVAELDRRFNLKSTGNYEVDVAFLALAARYGYQEAFPEIEQLVASVGRGKYLKRLYRLTVTDPTTRDVAYSWFEKYGPSYHPIIRREIENLFKNQTS